jgi:hypothetical protein
MRNTLKSLFFVALTVLASGSSLLCAADLPAPSATTAAPLVEVSQSDLQALQLRLDGLKQQISAANNYNQLEGPQDRVQTFILDVDRLSASLLPQQAQLAVQLGCSAPHRIRRLPPNRRKSPHNGRCSASKKQGRCHAQKPCRAQTKRSRADYTNRRHPPHTARKRTDAAHRQHPEPGLLVAIGRAGAGRPPAPEVFIDQVNLTWATVWAPGERFFTCVLVLLALAFWTVGRRLAERGLTWLCIHRMPEGRLRRSALAFASALATWAPQPSPCICCSMPAPATSR